MRKAGKRPDYIPRVCLGVVGVKRPTRDPEMGQKPMFPLSPKEAAVVRGVRRS
jgi:hypothetical protein